MSPYINSLGRIERALDENARLRQEIGKTMGELTKFAERAERLINERDAEIARLRSALQDCVTALDSKEMEGVWQYLHAHGYKWTGPVMDMIKVRRVLEEK